MNIPDAAIDAAAEALREAWPADFSARLLARAAVEAAMPAIREALAQEIEAMGGGAIDPSWHDAKRVAARIVRGGTP